MLSRRRFLELSALGLGGVVCPAFAPRSAAAQRGGADGRLTARPGRPDGVPPPGRTTLGMSDVRDGLLYVPSGYNVERAHPLVLMLHGANGSAAGGIRPFESLADEAGLILVVPESRGRTWDIVTGGFGPDVRHIDAVLRQVFARCNVDPKRLAIEGFSDGASYALSLGLTNGDLFSHVVAFSPGFAEVALARGRPAVFMSHGTNDRILPIDRTSRRVARSLRAQGYHVTYREFAEGHRVPAEIALEAVTFITGPKGQR